MIKNYIIPILLFLIIILSISTYTFLLKIKDLNDKISTASANEKAFISENTSLKNSNRVYQFTIEQLNYYNDSILSKLNDTKKELGIKDKNLLALQYLKSEATKVDTVVYTDTIFKDNVVDKDTIIGDEWYKVKIVLDYPSTIITEPSFISEKHIITNKRKETVNPPKKFFLFRWFQKKHWIMEVHVEEKNPYIINKHNKFIEIIE